MLSCHKVLYSPSNRCRQWVFLCAAAALLLQELPPRSYTGGDTVAWLRDSMLTLRLEGTAAADVAVSGAHLRGEAARLVCRWLPLATL